MKKLQDKYGGKYVLVISTTHGRMEVVVGDEELEPYSRNLNKELKDVITALEKQR